MIEHILKTLLVSAPTLVAMAVIISTMCVYTLCQSKNVNVIVKWISPPIVFTLIFASLVWIYSIYGLPRYEQPVGKWTYVWHEERFVDKTSHALLVAYTVKDKTERLYLFAVNDEEKKKLREMKEGKLEGRQAIAEFEEKDGHNQYRENNEDMLRYKFADEFPVESKAGEDTASRESVTNLTTNLQPEENTIEKERHRLFTLGH
tara:strand:- start:96 stop:707 length:612 start_codon:yes stop_codon:yes gene_type:complete